MLKIHLLRHCVLFFGILEIAFSKSVLRRSESGNEEENIQVLKSNYFNTQKILSIATEKRNELQWPLGVVPYYLDDSSYDHFVADRIRLAMNTIEEASCIQFKPLKESWHDAPWIHITNKDRVRACVHEASTNTTGMETVMVLGLDCMNRHDILHSLMHALGFKDEVTHPQRDQYIRILWDNINPSYRSLFYLAHDDFPTKTIEYDPMSIMHFQDRAFTKNGEATIAPLVPGLLINPSRELSPLDKMKLRLMFGHECNRRKVGDILDVCKSALKEGGEYNDEYKQDDGGVQNPGDHQINDDDAEGNSGKNGEDGADGDTGDGEDGNGKYNGADGEDGEDGKDGVDAGDDRQEVDGEQEVDSQHGVDGKDGNDGGDAKNRGEEEEANDGVNNAVIAVAGDGEHDDNKPSNLESRVAAYDGLVDDEDSDDSAKRRMPVNNKGPRRRHVTKKNHQIHKNLIK